VRDVLLNVLWIIWSLLAPTVLAAVGYWLGTHSADRALLRCRADKAHVEARLDDAATAVRQAELAARIIYRQAQLGVWYDTFWIELEARKHGAITEYR
jgi:hypothetical protein